MLTYGFFNSVNGDRLYNADDISNYFLKLISDGVFATPANAMQVTAFQDMDITVSSGWAFVKCKWLNNSSNYQLELDAADIALNRIDRVVVRLNPLENSRCVELAIVKGTPAATPTAPALTRVDGGIWELSLAQIYVAANATAITQADITDERPDTSVCGFVTGLIDQIDTTNLFAQYNAAFYAWFNGVKDQVLRNTLIRRYSRTETLETAPQDTFSVGISEYNPSLDVLNVYVNGLKLAPNTDYTTSGTDVILSAALDVVGTEIEFEILKSIDGSQAESIVSDLYALQQRVTALETQLGGHSIWSGTQAQYDAITAKDSATVYVVTED